MRKIVSSIMLVAAAAMTFVSCQKEENRAPETVTTTLTMHAGVDQTKTYLDENNTVLWGKGEAVKLYVGAGENEKFVSSTSTDAYEGAAIASFGFLITGLEPAESYNLGGIYPASATVDNKNPETYKVVLSDVQEAEVGKYDPSAYIMVLKPKTVETLPTEYQASFRRATALNKITLTGVKEDISSVEITVPEGKDFAGRRYFNLMDGTSGDIYYGKSNTITVKAPFTGSEIDVWFCSWGVELAAGDKLTVKLTATENTYTHTITAREQGIVFAEGDLNKLSINMADVNADEQEKPEQPDQPDGAVYYEKVTSAPTDWSGQYLIVYEDNATATAYVFNGKDEVNGYVSATINNNNTIDATVDLADVEVAIGAMNGGYSVKTVDGYICGKAGDNDLIFGTDPQLTTIELDENGNAILTSNSTTFRFNSTSNQMRFRYYKSGQKAVSLYKLIGGETPDQPEDETPVITAKAPEEMAAAGGNGSFTFSITNPVDGNKVTTDVDVDWITDVTVGNEQVSYEVSENTGAARSAEITLSYEGAVSKKVTVTQAAAEQSSGSEGVETVVEIVAADLGLADASTLSNIKNGLLVFAKGSNTSNSPKYYDNGTNLRMYAGNTLTISAPSGSTLTSIEFTFSSSNYDNLSASLGSYSNCRWSGNAESVIFTTAAGKQTRITKVVVTYSTSGGNVDGGETPEPGEPETPVEPTLTPRNLTFSRATATATMEQAFTAPTLSGAKIDDVTYSSSNTGVATVNSSTGAVTLVGVGTTTIKALALATDRYEAGEATYTLTVSPATSGNATITITLDMSKNIFGLSTSKANAATSEISKTYEGYTYKFKATDSFYYYGSKATLIGKANSYITFPAIEGYKLTSVEAHNCDGASAKGSIVICSTSNTTAVSGGTASTIAAGGSKTWILSGTAVDTAYRFYITNANAVQLTKMVLTYKKN